MDKAAVAADLQTLLKQPVIIDSPMSKHTTWKIGGPADIMVFPTCEEELCALLPRLKEQGISWLVIGNGSNLLVADKGIRGVVIKMGENFADSQWRGLTVKASAGMLLASLALEAAERGAAGIEFARGIPGSVGGAVRMNAGAYGSNIGNYVIKVEGVDYDGHRLSLSGSELNFSYRDSSLFGLDAVVTYIYLQLLEGKRDEIMEKMKEYQQKRFLAQPLEYPSCGSVFRNPANDHAGRLVEMAGLRGLRIGNAQVSPKHGNFIINLGGATAQDVRELISEVQQQVYEYSGVRLEPEVKMVGDFD